MASKSPVVSSYARMWPREVFDHVVKGEGRQRALAQHLNILKESGIYILYTDSVPYYIGKATKMHSRLWLHAWDPRERYYNFWNFFSFFVVEDSDQRDELEGILIAAMPTANSSRPRIPRQRLDPRITAMLREIRKSRANPAFR